MTSDASKMLEGLGLWRRPEPDPDTRRELDRSALEAVAAVAWLAWEYAPTPEPGAEDVTDTQIGPTLDDLTANPLLATAVRRDAEGSPVAYDLPSLVGVLGKAITELATQVADLRRQVEKKPDTAKFPWEPGWSPFG